VTVYVEAERLEAGLAHILASPSDLGTVELVVRRPAEGEREILDEGVVDFPGLVGDRHTLRQDTHPGTEITLMNARVVDLVAGGDRERWALAGDQLYVDFDLRHENLPPGTRLQVGSATLEVSEMPHTGCAKFTSRFGSDATRFINAKPNRELRLRGMNARVITPGTVRPGDTIQKRGGSVPEVPAAGEDHGRAGC
jgi:MOSC domain-containing protein YiiM